jgi:hypothetical protein
MTWKLYALISGSAFVATYLVSGPAAAPPVRQQPRAAVKPAAPGTSDTDMQALADHLEQSRVRNEVRYRQPTRNPFAFAQAPRPEPRQVIAPKAIETAPVVVAPPPPPVTLSGIASDRVNGEWKRTAIFSSSNGVSLAHEGEMVGGGYRVVTIGENAVTLDSTGDGSKVTLSLTRP